MIFHFYPSHSVKPNGAVFLFITHNIAKSDTLYLVMMQIFVGKFQNTLFWVDFLVDGV